MCAFLDRREPRSKEPKIWGCVWFLEAGGYRRISQRLWSVSHGLDTQQIGRVTHSEHKHLTEGYIIPQSVSLAFPLSWTPHRSIFLTILINGSFVDPTENTKSGLESDATLTFLVSLYARTIKDTCALIGPS